MTGVELAMSDNGSLFKLTICALDHSTTETIKGLGLTSMSFLSWYLSIKGCEPTAEGTLKLPTL